MTFRCREAYLGAVILKSSLKYDWGSLNRVSSKHFLKTVFFSAFSDRKSVKQIFCRSDFDFFCWVSRKRTFSVEMSYFITKMSDFCFSFDFGPPGGFEPVQSYFQGRLRMSTAPGGTKLYSPARNRSYFKQKVSYFIQNWRIIRLPHRISTVYLTSDAQTSFSGHILRKMS